MNIDEKFMKEAIRQAKKAALAGDVPIGCVIVKEDKIIARGYNKRNAKKAAKALAIGEEIPVSCTVEISLTSLLKRST